MARRVAQHRIFDLAATLLIISVVTTLRSSLLPHSDEAIANVATPLGEWLMFAEERIPILSVIIWGLSLIVAGLNVGRYGVRLSLYPAYTLMAIPTAICAANSAAQNPVWRRGYTGSKRNLRKNIKFILKMSELLRLNSHYIIEEVFRNVC